MTWAPAVLGLAAYCSARASCFRATPCLSWRQGYQEVVACLSVNSMIKFNAKYFYLAVSQFLIETSIAIFLDDRIIRPLVGDILAVVLIYCFIKAFWQIRPITAALGVFIFACLIEGLQYLQLVDRLGLSDNRLIATILGTTFDSKDVLAYAIGAVLVLVAEYCPTASGQWNR